MGGDVISNGVQMLAKTAPDKASGELMNSKLTISQEAVVLDILEESPWPEDLLSRHGANRTSLAMKRVRENRIPGDRYLAANRTMAHALDNTIIQPTARPLWIELIRNTNWL